MCFLGLSQRKLFDFRRNLNVLLYPVTTRIYSSGSPLHSGFNSENLESRWVLLNLVKKLNFITIWKTLKFLFVRLQSQLLGLLYRNDKSRLISLPISNQYCNSVCLKVGKETRPTLWEVMPSDVWHQLSWNKQRSVVTQNTKRSDHSRNYYNWPWL